MRVRAGQALLATVAAAALVVCACTGGGGTRSGTPTASGTHFGVRRPPIRPSRNVHVNQCDISPLTCNTGTARRGGQVTYAVEDTVRGWNINYTGSDVFGVTEMLDPITANVFTPTPDLRPTLNTDLMIAATQTRSSPQTLVYRIRPDAVWSDGVPINVDDFLYQWQTSNGVSCPKCGASTRTGYDQIPSITGSDNGKTVTVVMKSPEADWQRMFGPLYPAHIAQQHGDDGTAAGLNASFRWFDRNVPTWSGGPFMIKTYVKDASLVEVPNPRWYGTTQPSLDRLIFDIFTARSDEVAALRKHDIDVLYTQPDKDLVTQINSIQGVQTALGSGLAWEHLTLNERSRFLRDKALRTAIFTAIDRHAVIARAVGTFVPGVAPLSNHIYVPGQAGYQDNITATGQGTGDAEQAKQILTRAGYTGVGSRLTTKVGAAVTIRCTYSLGNAERRAICRVVQAELKQLGIGVTLNTTPDLGEYGTGDYDLLVFAWVGTPYIVGDARQVYEFTGGGDYPGIYHPRVEDLINRALATADPVAAGRLMNRADALIAADAYELPLYRQPTFLAADDDLVNIRDNPTGVGPPYNTADWGISST